MKEKLISIVKRMFLVFFLVLTQIHIYSQETNPAPEDAPTGFGDRSGPPPPPPVPINSNITILLIAGFVLGFTVCSRKYYIVKSNDNLK